MLLFDRNGFNVDHYVYSSRYYARKACEFAPCPFSIRKEIIDGETCYSVWLRYSFLPPSFEGESS